MFKVNNKKFKTKKSLREYLFELIEGSIRIKFFYVSSDHTFEADHCNERKAWDREMTIMVGDYLPKHKFFKFLKDDKKIYEVSYVKAN